MDQPDAVETNCPSAPILVCRRSRRLQTTTIDNLVHGRVARSLTLTNHRVSANAASTTTSTLNIRLRPVRPGKHELRGTDRTVHIILILSTRRTLGRILRKHGRPSLRLSLPDRSIAILEIALRSKVRCDVRSLNSALPNTSMDLGPHSHNSPSVHTHTLERDTALSPPRINSWDPRCWRSSRCPEEHYLRDPFSSRRSRDQTTYQR